MLQPLLPSGLPGERNVSLPSQPGQAGGTRQAVVPGRAEGKASKKYQPQEEEQTRRQRKKEDSKFFQPTFLRPGSKVLKYNIRGHFTVRESSASVTTSAKVKPYKMTRPLLG